MDEYREILAKYGNLFSVSTLSPFVFPPEHGLLYMCSAYKQTNKLKGRASRGSRKMGTLAGSSKHEQVKAMVYGSGRKESLSLIMREVEGQSGQADGGSG